MRRGQPLRKLFRTALALSILALTNCQPPAAGEAFVEPTPAPSVTLALLGDVMVGRDVHPDAETFAYLEPFLKSADLALANLESPLSASPVQTASPYALCAPPENVRYLVQAGFDSFTLANNHRLDCGTQGLSDTQQALKDSGLGFVDTEPVYRSVNGIPLAFLAFDATGKLDAAAAVQAARSAHETGAAVIVSLHWGVEYQSGAAPDQKQIAGELAKAGAALIWGHHPHVLQPAEWIGKSLVLYSLGNALFDQYGLEATRRSALIQVTLDPQGVREFKAVPFVIDVQHSRIMEADQMDAQIVMQYFK